MEKHPAWCAYCTAYGPDEDGYHRSAPVAIETDDPGVLLYIYKEADADGTGEYITIAALEIENADQPWHLREPLHEIYLPRGTAYAVSRAVAQLA